MEEKFDFLKVKKELVDFAARGVERFLQEHPDLEFYAFAFDCNAEYAEVNLCLNTEIDFARTLFEYQERAPDAYRDPEDIHDLKYNTGDWEYQCFDTMYPLTTEQLEAMLEDLPEDEGEDALVESLTRLFTEAVLDFTQTNAYKKIPKTADFIVYSIDHDEDVEDAFERLAAIKQERSI